MIVDAWSNRVQQRWKGVREDGLAGNRGSTFRARIRLMGLLASSSPGILGVPGDQHQSSSPGGHPAAWQGC